MIPSATIISASLCALALGQDLASPTPAAGEIRIASSFAALDAHPRQSTILPRPALAVADLVSLEPGQAVRTKRAVRMTVRLLGAAYQPYGEDAPVNFQVKTGSGKWETVFHGTSRELGSSARIFSAEAPAGTIINFAGAGKLSDRRWTASRNTLRRTRNILALRDGDRIPDHLPALRQGTIKEHVAGHLKDGRVRLRPNELIYLIELGQSDPARPGFDLQDLVAVATFDPLPVSQPEPASQARRSNPESSLPR